LLSLLLTAAAESAALQCPKNTVLKLSVKGLSVLCVCLTLSL
jgi:hypothetical protein